MNLRDLYHFLVFRWFTAQTIKLSESLARSKIDTEQPPAAYTQKIEKAPPRPPTPSTEAQYFPNFPFNLMLAEVKKKKK